MKLIHRLFKPFQKHDPEGFCRLAKDLINTGPLDSIKNVQHIVGWVHPLGRSSNAHLQSQEVIPAHVLDDRTHSLMSSVSSPLFETKPAEGEIQIIMNDDEIFHFEVEKVGHLFDRFSTSIHERHWFGQDDLPGVDPSRPVEGAETSGADRNVVRLGDTIDDLESNIVPAHSILGSRITQAHDDLHTRLFFFLLLLLLLFLLLLLLSPFNRLRSHCFHSLLLYRRGHDRGDGKIRL